MEPYEFEIEITNAAVAEAFDDWTAWKIMLMLLRDQFCHHLSPNGLKQLQMRALFREARATGAGIAVKVSLEKADVSGARIGGTGIPKTGHILVEEG